MDSDTVFLLTHPVWDVTFLYQLMWNDGSISTHTSRVGCDAIFLHGFRRALISTHTSRVGCDGLSTNVARHRKKFLLTHPVWDVTTAYRVACLASNISTHTSRVGCDANTANNCIVQGISTHTSRVGCDGYRKFVV